MDGRKERRKDGWMEGREGGKKKGREGGREKKKRKISCGLTLDIIPELHLDVWVFLFLIGWSSNLGWTLRRGSRVLETKWTR